MKTFVCLLCMQKLNGSDVNECREAKGQMRESS